MSSISVGWQISAASLCGTEKLSTNNFSTTLYLNVVGRNGSAFATKRQQVTARQGGEEAYAQEQRLRLTKPFLLILDTIE